MTRLNDEEKEALHLAGQGDDFCDDDSMPPWIVEPNRLNLERYFRALSQFSLPGTRPKPVEFGGEHWKL